MNCEQNECVFFPNSGQSTQTQRHKLSFLSKPSFEFIQMKVNVALLQLCKTPVNLWWYKIHFFNDCDTAKIFADAETASQENFNLTSTGDLEDELCKDLLPPKMLLCFAF